MLGQQTQAWLGEAFLGNEEGKTPEGRKEQRGEIKILMLFETEMGIVMIVTDCHQSASGQDNECQGGAQLSSSRGSISG